MAARPYSSPSPSPRTLREGVPASEYTQSRLPPRGEASESSTPMAARAERNSPSRRDTARAASTLPRMSATQERPPLAAISRSARLTWTRCAVRGLPRPDPARSLE
ncbi:hypothetical protein [Collinsella sp. An7]|uniref:hypothetical protein n=1 Tax=Collinsella sp. An7 TaxID=1965651 RepID=UPI001EF49434|nr:hypothetical protein [Collinsella sp. An7]